MVRKVQSVTKSVTRSVTKIIIGFSHAFLDFCIEKPGKPKLSGFDAPECAVEM